jgi:hypothetical protein
MKKVILGILVIIMVYLNYLAAKGTYSMGILATHTPPSAWVPSVVSLLILGGYIGWVYGNRRLELVTIWLPVMHLVISFIGAISMVGVVIYLFLILAVPFNYFFEVLATGYLFTAILRNGFSYGRVVGLLMNVGMFLLILFYIVMNTVKPSF